ncbi:hypothetical protein BV898_03299 [Hypsibius exemplaris]|uniref:ZP domain-containing protein n=1 Tax=Hypsibius exemplaris TaxID=2072580 RepID=A0A1W0X5K0_HYPEX|nr:hypothetical protein BV898_03299 [Hypsibius exemplaris]
MKVLFFFFFFFVVLLFAPCYAQSQLEELFQQPADQVLTLSGEYSEAEDRGEACTGAGCPSPPREGPSQLYWHGDGSCSRLVLTCKYNEMLVAVESPGQAVEVYVGWLGLPSVPKRPAIPVGCSQANVFSVTVNNHTTESPPVHYDDNACGTLVVKKSDDVTQFSNEVHILEFLAPFGQELRDPKIQIYSHTHIKVQCCRTSSPHLTNCTPPRPPRHNNETVSNCTEKSFKLDCISSSNGYECSLRLDKSVTPTLGDNRVKFVLDSCHATALQETYPLISQGVGNREIDVEVKPVKPTANADDTVFEFSGPHIQFNDDPFNYHDVTITCHVIVVKKEP